MRTTMVTLVDETCVNCGTPYAIEQTLWNKFKNYGGNFYCPSGHRQSYTTPELEKAKQRIKSLEAWSRTQEDQLQAERFSHAATKGWLTRTRNKIANGVCPECHRHFTSVERHMQTKHPEFVQKIATKTSEVDAAINKRAAKARKKLPPRRNKHGDFIRKQS